MSTYSERSHHEQGPGQNEINFRYSDLLIVADNTMTFQTVMKTVAGYNGLIADFNPKPLAGRPDSGLRINISAKVDDDPDHLHQIITGIPAKVCDMILFLDPLNYSYRRFGNDRAPQYISRPSENRSQLIRIPAIIGKYCRVELRPPDPTVNSYLALALVVYAGLYGIRNYLQLAGPIDINPYEANTSALSRFKMLPSLLRDACESTLNNDFVKQRIPNEILGIHCHR